MAVGQRRRPGRALCQPATKSRPRSLAAKNLAKGRFDELKILGDGELTKKLKISAHRFSESATEKIEKAGGAGDRAARARRPVRQEDEEEADGHEVARPQGRRRVSLQG